MLSPTVGCLPGGNLSNNLAKHESEREVRRREIYDAQTP
jgi:hypothetical protein